MESVAAKVGFFAGGLLSFAIGHLLSPPWEMAFLTIDPLCLVLGAFVGLLSAQSWKGTSLAALLALLTAAGLGALVRKNPDWVVRQAVIAVAAGPGVSIMLGLVARRVGWAQSTPRE